MDDPAPTQTPPTPVEPGEEARRWATFVHLSALVGLLGNGIGFLLGPLIVWAIKKDDHPFVDDQGKEAINFQLSVVIAGAICVALIFTVVGIVIAVPALLILAVVAIVFPIVAGLQANEGKAYRYPFSWRLIK